MTTEKSTVIADITNGIRTALGDSAEVGDKPYDISNTAPNKISIRVRPEGWAVDDALLESGNPLVGMERITVLARVRLQHWDYDSIRPENRKIVNALENLGWQLSDVDYDEDADYIDTTLLFMQKQVAPY